MVQAREATRIWRMDFSENFTGVVSIIHLIFPKLYYKACWKSKSLSKEDVLIWILQNGGVNTVQKLRRKLSSIPLHSSVFC